MTTITRRRVIADHRTHESVPPTHPGHGGYICPHVAGMTIDQAEWEWTHRYGVREVTFSNPYNVQYNRGGGIVETWEGFTGAITSDVANPDGSEIVASFTTDPAGAEGDRLPANAALQLTISLSAGTYYLATPAGDPLETAGGDRLYVEID